MLLAGTALLLGLRRPSVVQASAFQLVGPLGDVRAELVLRTGEPGLYLRDPQGRDRAALLSDSSATGLYLYDSTGTTRVGVAQFSHGGGGFALHGPSSRGAAVLYLKGSGSLRFFNDSGVVTNAVLSTPP